MPSQDQGSEPPSRELDELKELAEALAGAPEFSEIDHAFLCNDAPAIVERAEARIAELEGILRTKVAVFRCPVHSNAACPEEYMLMQNGLPHPVYEGKWSEDMRCGQRFTLAALEATT